MCYHRAQLTFCCSQGCTDLCVLSLSLWIIKLISQGCQFPLPRHIDLSRTFCNWIILQQCSIREHITTRFTNIFDPFTVNCLLQIATNDSLQTWNFEIMLYFINFVWCIKYIVARDFWDQFSTRVSISKYNLALLRSFLFYKAMANQRVLSQQSRTYLLYSKPFGTGVTEQAPYTYSLTTGIWRVAEDMAKSRDTPLTYIIIYTCTIIF